MSYKNDVKIVKEDMIIKFDASQETKDKVFSRLIAFYLEHESFSGECIQQSDGPLIDAPYVLSDLADDVICFDVEYIDD